MILNRSILQQISGENIVVPDTDSFKLPEKVLQFGTGRLLRGLPDYYINKANKSGIFNGRVVAVKSTNKGDVAAYRSQDNLYTICEREIINGNMVEANTISAAVSRVLVAQDEWQEVLQCAYNKELKIIISNTTEVGIQLLPNEDIRRNPPLSFPGKLLAFLYERFKAFQGSSDSGMIVIPTELIPDNGKKLKSVLTELAFSNQLENTFIEWLETSNHFCSSLVDRIVSVPNETNGPPLEKQLGYKDNLLTITEMYSLWAIEGDEQIKEILSFQKADNGIVIIPDIKIYRELKLRLLNAPHTFTCGVAFLAGYDTVQHTMEDKLSESFISDLIFREIIPSISGDIDPSAKEEYAAHVLNRFRNPFMNHYWKNITLNYSSKIGARCVPLILNYYKKNNSAPPLFSLAFAAYLFFMKAVKQTGKDFFGIMNDEYYIIEDQYADKFHSLWQNSNIEDVVSKVLKDEFLWGADLSLLPGFQKLVTSNLHNIIQSGMKKTLSNFFS